MVVFGEWKFDIVFSIILSAVPLIQKGWYGHSRKMKIWYWFFYNLVRRTLMPNGWYDHSQQMKIKYWILNNIVRRYYNPEGMKWL